MLRELLGDRLPAIKVVDVGAMLIDEPEYMRLLSLPGASLVAFEPAESERAKLAASLGPNSVVLGHVVGRGGPGVFRSNVWSATSSLYEPNVNLLRRISGLEQAHVVKERIPVETVRLDDIPEAQGARMLKLDVQGAELDVLAGAPKLLETVVAVHLEVQFIPLYEGVPLQGDVDVQMRKLGFTLYTMTPGDCGTFAPLRRKPGIPGGQWMWADALYIRDFMSFASLQTPALLALAVILEVAYAVRDLPMLLLQHVDAKEGTHLCAAYSTALFGSLREPPPL